MPWVKKCQGGKWVMEAPPDKQIGKEGLPIEGFDEGWRWLSGRNSHPAHTMSLPEALVKGKPSEAGR